MTPFQLYFILKLDSMIFLANGIFVFSLLFYVGMFLLCWITVMNSYSFDSYGEELNEEKREKRETLKKKYLYPHRPLIVTGLIVGALLSTFLPTTKEASIIYVVPRIMNNPTIQQNVGKLGSTSTKLIDLANEYLDKQIKEVKESKK